MKITSGGMTENEGKAFWYGVTFVPSLPNGKLTLICIMPSPKAIAILNRRSVDELIFYAIDLYLIIYRESLQKVKNGSAGIFANVLYIFVGTFAPITIPTMDVFV